MSKAWIVRLGHQAEQDFVDIARWTAVKFGIHQAETYTTTISLAVEALRSGPEILGAKVRDEIETGIRTLHVAQNGRNGRHLVAFRVGGDHIIDVLRLLHDSMDLARHLPVSNDPPQ